MALRSKGEESVRKKKEEKLELRLGQGEWRVERLTYASAVGSLASADPQQ